MLKIFRYYHQPGNEDAAARYIKQVYRVYAVLEAQLKKGGGESILPGKIKTADIHYIPWIRPSQYIGLSLEECPLLAKWTKIMCDKPEFKQALQRMQHATAKQDSETAARVLKPDLNSLRQTGVRDNF